MTKVKFISGSRLSDFENSVNSFIAEHDGWIKDIKFQVIGEHQSKITYSVMIIYTEIGNG